MKILKHEFLSCIENLNALLWVLFRKYHSYITQKDRKKDSLKYVFHFKIILFNRIILKIEADESNISIISEASPFVYACMYAIHKYKRTFICE